MITFRDSSALLFINSRIEERATECGEYRERGECSLGFRGISLRIPGNVIILRFPEMLKKIPGNVQEGSGECSVRFRGMFEKIPGNVQEISGECLRRFPEMFEKVPGNLTLDLFCEFLLIFYQILQLSCGRRKEYFLRYCLLPITNLLRLNTVFLSPFSFLFSFPCRGKNVITVRRCRGIKKL